MPSHLDTLRRIRVLSESADPLRQIDPDLSREAGMDGNYGRLLQAARDLDAAETPTPAPTAHTPEPWSQKNGKVYATDPRDGGLSQVATTEYSAFTWDDEEANAARIVAAVNACAGIADPAAAIAAARAVLKDLVQSYGDSAFGAWRALELLGEK